MRHDVSPVNEITLVQMKEMQTGSICTYSDPCKLELGTKPTPWRFHLYLQQPLYSRQGQARDIKTQETLTKQTLQQTASPDVEMLNH